jgi:hypothetical protein
MHRTFIPSQPLTFAQLCWAALLGLTTLLPDAHAARPLSTDDTATAESCQLEAFHEGVRNDPHEHNTVVAAACPAAPGLELGLEAAHFQPLDEGRWGLTAGIKWAPASWQWAGARWGLKFGLPLIKGAAQGWHTQGALLLGLTSWELSPELTVHLNLGLNHKRREAITDRVARWALVWTPADPWLLFAEALTEQRNPVQQIVGLRYWLQQDTLGLDATWGRLRSDAGANGANSFTVGLGWYGLGLR